MSRTFPSPHDTVSLSAEEIEGAVEALLSANVPDESKERFLLDLHERAETAAELAGFARVLLDRSVKPLLNRDAGGGLLELCGTGGDKAGFLNISTAAMFVAAGAGARVIKHGNRAFTSRCGSADVLEAMGVDVHLDPSRVGEVLDKAGCVFMLASDFHPTVATVAPMRRRLGAQGKMTVFNLLGPLLNPALPDYQLTGIYRAAMLPLYAEAMRLLGRRRAWAVHGEGISEGEGLDELSVTGSTRIVEISRELPGSRELLLDPRDLGLDIVTETSSLLGGDATANARRILAILGGEEKGAARDMILLNASAALHLAGIGSSHRMALEIARESIDTGAAFRALELLRES
jgi:anthranilate phosphoribosyltransferase